MDIVDLIRLVNTIMSSVLLSLMVSRGILELKKTTHTKRERYLYFTFLGYVTTGAYASLESLYQHNPFGIRILILLATNIIGFYAFFCADHKFRKIAPEDQ